MPSTYTLIKGETLASSAASYTFTAIPSTFTDLVLRISTRNNDSGASELLRIQFNGDTATNYSSTYMQGSGSTASSARATSLTFDQARQNGAAATANTFSNTELYIPSYTVSQNKPFSNSAVSETNSATNNSVWASGDLWRNTAAITSIALYNASTLVFQAGSSFYLYGIKNS